MNASGARDGRTLAGLAAPFALALALLAAATGARADDTSASAPGNRPGDDAIAALEAVAQGRAVIIMRHALAPGTGDPARFDRADCTTQRNLSQAGREQARRIGARLAAALDTDAAQVYSSAWCRCLETARLLGLGEVERLPGLDSFFQERDEARARTVAVRTWIDTRLSASGDDDGPPAVLVTHQVNVTALTGVYPTSGEIVVFGRASEAASERADAELEVLARIAPDD